MAKTQEIVFTIEYSVPIEDKMTIDLNGVLEKMREDGSAKVVKVEVRNG